MSPHARPPAGAVRAAALAALAFGLLSIATPAHARILKTRRTAQPGRELALVVGSGFEYETDGEESEYGFPFLVEYGLTSMLKASVEPGYVLIRKKAGGTVRGPGDLETTITCEFPTERRYRPGLALESTIKWPTAPTGDIGTGKADYSIGAIISKEFVGFDLDANLIYTFVGNPPGLELKDTFEGSLASEWHLTPVLDLEAEAVTSFGAGGRFRGRAGSLGGFANIGGPEQGESEWEVTAGLAEHVNDLFKLEQGVIYKNGGSYQIVLAWEWDFGGGR